MSTYDDEKKQRETNKLSVAEQRKRESGADIEFTILSLALRPKPGVSQAPSDRERGEIEKKFIQYKEWLKKRENEKRYKELEEACTFKNGFITFSGPKGIEALHAFLTFDKTAAFSMKCGNEEAAKSQLQVLADKPIDGQSMLNKLKEISFPEKIGGFTMMRTLDKDKNPDDFNKFIKSVVPSFEPIPEPSKKKPSIFDIKPPSPFQG